MSRYQSRRVYTLSDVPGISPIRAALRIMREAAGCIVCAIGAILEDAGRRVDNLGARILGEWRPGDGWVHPYREERYPDLSGYTDPTADPEAFRIDQDADTAISWHLDPEADTAIAPALPASLSPVPAALAPVATLANCRESFCESAAIPASVFAQLSAHCGRCAVPLVR